MTQDDTWPPSDGSSGIPEDLSRHVERKGSLFPDFFTVHFDKESGCLVLLDQGGFIPTEDEFWSLIEILHRAYERIDTDRIEAHNRANYERLMGEKRGMQQSPRPKPVRKPEPGYVYVLQGEGVFKIGRAKDPKKRAELLAIQLPCPVALVCCVHTDDYKSLEAELHERFSEKRLNGEWFDLSPEEVAYIKGLAK